MLRKLNQRRYLFPNSTQQLVIEEAALKTFAAYKQFSNATEAGGLLFASFDLPVIRLVSATPPHSLDKRWYRMFIPDRVQQRLLIRRNFSKMLHFVGEWHTHPEPVPQPSSLDLESKVEAFHMSKHELNYFVLIIVGNRKNNLELSVSAHDGKTHLLLEPMQE